MNHFGVACGHFQFSVTPQGVDSVFAGNGPSKGAASRESTPLSPRCAQIRHAFAQVIHRFAHRRALACRDAGREIAGTAAAPEPRDARFMLTMGPLPPTQGNGSCSRWVRWRRHRATRNRGRRLLQDAGSPATAGIAGPPERACGPAWIAGAITRRAATEATPSPEGFASTPGCPPGWMPRAERPAER
jgi:hypothetical protein